MSSLGSLLLPPSEGGLLAKWIYFIAMVSFFNTAQCYATTNLTQRVYPLGHAAKHVTPLSSRTFGTWTLLTGVVRLFAAQRLSDPAWYDLTLATFVVAGLHFGSELLVFHSTRVNSGALPSLVIAAGTMVWMVLAR